MSIGLGIALIAVGSSTVAHAALPSLAQHLSAVDASVATQYVGKAPYRVVNTAELERMKEYIQSQYAGVQSVHAYAYDENLVVDCVNRYTQLSAIRHGLNADNWKSAPKSLPRFTSETRPTREAPLRDPGVFLTRTDTDSDGNLRGCAPGSVPVNRITLEHDRHFSHLDGLP